MSKLHIGNLAKSTRANTLTEVFAREGRQVVSVQVVMSRDPAKSRGFAFVQMGSDADAAAALQALHGAEIDGSTVAVTHANPPKSRYGGYRRVP